jgi:hypothetical protein
LVVLRVPRQPVGRRQLHLGAKLLLRERLVADDVDARDAGGVAFHDVEVDGDAIAFLRCHRRLHGCRVFAARNVLALQFLFRALQRRPVEDERFADANVLQRLLDRVAVEFLVADESQGRDRRALLHDHDEDVTLRLDADVAKKPVAYSALTASATF